MILTKARRGESPFAKMGKRVGESDITLSSKTKKPSLHSEETVFLSAGQRSLIPNYSAAVPCFITSNALFNITSSLEKKTSSWVRGTSISGNKPLP